MEVFHQAWTLPARRLLRRRSSTASTGRAARAAYAPRIAGAQTPDEMRRVLNLMVGELNASHLGIARRRRAAAPATSAGSALRFDRARVRATGRAARSPRSSRSVRPRVTPAGRARRLPRRGRRRDDRAARRTSTSCSRTRSTGASLLSVAPHAAGARRARGRRAAGQPGDREGPALPRSGSRSNRAYVAQGERRPARLRAHARHVGGRARRSSTSISTPTTTRATASSSTCATTTAAS